MNEVMGYPNGALSSEYWFPWYDNLTLTSWVLMGRPHVGSEMTAYGGFTEGGQAINVPMLFKNMWGSYNSALYLQNTDGGWAALVTLKFYHVNGNLSCTRTDTIPALATVGYGGASVSCAP